MTFDADTTQPVATTAEDAAGDTAPPSAASGDPALDALIRRVPKAELHLHFHGGLRPSVLNAARTRNGMPANHDLESPDEWYDYRSYEKFFGDLDRTGALLIGREDVTWAALDIIGGAYDNGCRHVELMCSPFCHRLSGIHPSELLAGLGDAFAEAARVWGVTGGVIVEFERTLGPEPAIETVRQAIAARDRGVPVVGIGNDGNPEPVPFAALGPGYDAARSAGFRLCGHVGSAQDVVDALSMGLDRLDHAFVLVDLEDARRRVRDAGVPLTVCVSSNCMMHPDRFPDLTHHPLDQFRREGLVVALGTDDPPLYFTDLSQEYRFAVRTWGWSRDEVADVALGSLRAAWIDSRPADRLSRWEDEAAALVADPWAPKREGQSGGYWEATIPPGRRVRRA